jgi:hypothetical protein
MFLDKPGKFSLAIRECAFHDERGTVNPKSIATPIKIRVFPDGTQKQKDDLKKLNYQF